MCWCLGSLALKNHSRSGATIFMSDTLIIFHLFRFIPSVLLPLLLPRPLYEQDFDHHDTFSLQLGSPDSRRRSVRRGSVRRGPFGFWSQRMENEGKLYKHEVPFLQVQTVEVETDRPKILRRLHGQLRSRAPPHLLQPSFSTRQRLKKAPTRITGGDLGSTFISS